MYRKQPVRTSCCDCHKGSQGRGKGACRGSDKNGLVNMIRVWGLIINRKTLKVFRQRVHSTVYILETLLHKKQTGPVHNTLSQKDDAGRAAGSRVPKGGAVGDIQETGLQ